MTRLKSTLLALSLLTASPVFAQTNITGDWDVTVDLAAGREHDAGHLQAGRRQGLRHVQVAAGRRCRSTAAR